MENVRPAATIGTSAVGRLSTSMDVALGLAQTRAERLASALERDLHLSRLPAGACIGTMEELRIKTGYGRATVSEAVRLLRDRGSIEIRPGRNGGLFVAAANPVVRLRHTLLTVQEETSTVEDALAVREALEGLIAADAARHGTKSDAADLRKLLNTMRRAMRNTDRFMRANWALHERVAQITPNELLKGVYLGTTRYVAESSTSADSDEPARQDTYLEARFQIHCDLVDAIIAKDVDAARAAVARHSGD